MNEATICDRCKKMRIVDEGNFECFELDQATGKCKQYRFICDTCLAEQRAEITRIYHCICGESDIEFPDIPGCACGIEMSNPNSLLHVEVDGLLRLHLWPDRAEMRNRDYHPEWRVSNG